MNQINALRDAIRSFLKVRIFTDPISYTIDAVSDHGSFQRQSIRFLGSENDTIYAYLLIPNSSGPNPAVLVHHQHNGERHLGKSEVVGLAGNPLQAFGAMLAKEGVMVLAMDSICFESRRKNPPFIDLEPKETDFLQHYNEMCYRLLRGETLMKKVLEDASIGLSLLAYHPKVIPGNLGLLGHSYGGNTVLFQGALDTRAAFSLASGALCRYKTKMEANTGIEMAEAIPGFLQFEIDDLVKCFASRRLMAVSSEADKYSADAKSIIDAVKSHFKENNLEDSLEHRGFPGGHPLTEEKTQFIIDWILMQTKRNC